MHLTSDAPLAKCEQPLSTSPPLGSSLPCSASSGVAWTRHRATPSSSCPSPSSARHPPGSSPASPTPSAGDSCSSSAGTPTKSCARTSNVVRSMIRPNHEQLSPQPAPAKEASRSSRVHAQGEAPGAESDAINPIAHVRAASEATDATVHARLRREDPTAYSHG